MLLPPYSSGVSATAGRNPLRVAVTPGGYDDMGPVLRELGFDVAEVVPGTGCIVNGVKGCCALFVNCPGSDVAAWRGDIASYARDGGTLFVSDLAHGVLETPPASGVAFDRPATPSQTVRARVADTELARLMGRAEVDLTFDLNHWAVATAVPKNARYLLDGMICVGPGQSQAMVYRMAPLAFMYPWEGGTVCYTSFHNRAQATELERTLLSLLALAPIAHASGTSITRLAQSCGLITRDAAT